MNLTIEHSYATGIDQLSKEFLVPADLRCAGEHSDHLYRLSSILLEQTATRPDRRDGEMFPFGRDLYRRHFGGSVGSKVIGWADDIGLIDRSEDYIVGSRSKLIRLADRFRDGRFRVVEIGHKPKSRVNLLRPAVSLDAVGQWLFRHLQRFKLPLSPECGNAWDGYLAYSFMTGRLRASRDTVGRVHSSVTGMSRVLRPS